MVNKLTRKNWQVGGGGGKRALDFFLFPQPQLTLFSYPPHPHHTQSSILWSNEWFYEVNYENQFCLPWHNQSACQFSWQSANVNKNVNELNLQVGRVVACGKGKIAPQFFTSKFVDRIVRLIRKLTYWLIRLQTYNNPYIYKNSTTKTSIAIQQLQQFTSFEARSHQTKSVQLLHVPH